MLFLHQAIRLFVLASLVLVAATASAQPAADGAKKPAAVKPGQPLPHMTIDPAKKTIDLDARVVLQDGDWIELLGCAPNSREHESIVVIDAMPSHVHTALLLIGLKHGSPIKWHWEKEVVHVIPPHGARVAISFVIKDNGKDVEIPANEWIMDKQQKRVVADNIWLFTGSKHVEAEGRKFYQADAEGNIISVVNFGDEVLGRPTQVTKDSDKGNLGVNTKKVPKVGTKLRVRLRPYVAKRKPLAVVVVSKTGAVQLNEKSIAIDALPAALQKLGKGAKPGAKDILLRADANMPPALYTPLLKAIGDANLAMIHEVVGVAEKKAQK